METALDEAASLAEPASLMPDQGLTLQSVPALKGPAASGGNFACTLILLSFALDLPVGTVRRLLFWGAGFVFSVKFLVRVCQ